MNLIYPPQQLRHSVLNRWLVSGVMTRNVRFEPMTMEGDINDWLLKGFSIHENPCRKQFVDQRRESVPALPVSAPPAPGQPVTLWDTTVEWNVYFPWGNPRVEQSGFYFMPTHMLRYAYTVVVSPIAHRAVLNLKTCGGAALWVNGSLAADFTPFTRNIEQQMQVEVELLAGENNLVICHEDLAERDTLYHFTLEYTGSAAIELLIPLPDSEDVEEIRVMERAFELAFLPTDSVTDGEVRLAFTEPFTQPKFFEMSYGSFFDGIKTTQLELEADRDHLVLAHTDRYSADYKYFELVARVGRTAIRKQFGTELYNSGFQPADSMSLTVEERKQIALECVAAAGIRNIHTAIAKLRIGGSAGETAKIILEGLTSIRERRDCADFYLIALYRFWHDYYGSGLFPESFWEQIKDTMLGFRYWIDEPGDDVMWFFSENHALLFHSCQLLAGQLFPQDTFLNSGQSGEQRRIKAETQLTGWFERFFEEGLAEWNSNAYIPIDVLGLVNLHDLAAMPELRERAKQALDLLYEYMAVEAHHGYLAATFGRSYEKELIGNHSAGTTSLMWAGYGVGNVNSTSFNVSMYLSDYTPPQEFADLQHLQPDEELVYRLEQGKNGYAKLYHYRTDTFAMSSIADFRPGARGYQEHVFHLAFSPEAQVWVNHPGEIYPYGSGRPCFWAGNGILPKVGQYKGLGILLFDNRVEHDADYTHAYFPTYAFTEVEQHGSWLFGMKDNAYVAVYAANGLRMTEAGPNRGREITSPGPRNVWILRASDKLEYGTYAQFMDMVRETTVDISLEFGDVQVNLNDFSYGNIEFSWERPFTVNGEAVPISGCGVKGSLERTTRALGVKD